MNYKNEKYAIKTLIFIALIFVFFALRSYINTRVLLVQGVKIEGKVVDIIEFEDEGEKFYRPVFEFKDKKYNEASINASTASSSTDYYIGEKETIIYNRKTSEARVVSFWGLYNRLAIFLILALFFLIPALALKLIIIKNRL